MKKEQQGFLLSAMDKGKPFTVYTSFSPDRYSEGSDPILFQNETIINWNATERLFCHIFWEDGHTVVSVQELSAGDCYNLRDLGGYLTADESATVKYGLLYRSDQPASMGEKAEPVYRDLGLKTVIDFRGSAEHSLWPDPEFPGLRNYWIPVFEENPTTPREHLDLPDIFAKDDEWKQRETDHFHESYLIMPFESPAYKKMFSCLLEGRVPMLIHCLAGKDRTGIGAMLILLALGIPERTIIADYLHRSAAYQAYIDFRRNQFQQHLVTDISLKHFSFFFGVLEENIEGSLNKIHKEYGTVENFFQESYQLSLEDLDHLRKMYLLPLK
ncbi:MAG: tyrosine-protein phosphatase [Oscillospiraceae bacterium]|nr:tyrosine-protein phosphatase [Oscillospiraceae bacterium]